MITFRNLFFVKRAPLYRGAEQLKQAAVNFDNGYGISVLLGAGQYSNGIDTYEVAVLKEGELCYVTPITDNVLGWQTKDQVEKIMIELQKY